MVVSVESSSNTLEFGSQNQNLVSKRKRMFRKSVIAIAIIGILLLGCVVFVYFYQNSRKLPEPESQKVPSAVTLDKVLQGAFDPRPFNGTWISDEEILMRDHQGYFVVFNVSSKTRRTILSDRELLSVAMTVLLSADKKYLLIGYNMQKSYRHSSFAQYLFYDIETQEKIYLGHEEQLTVQLATWSTEGNGYAYVYLNDIYYKPSVTSKEVFRITSNGNITNVYNGICDWVYEEEVFSDTNAMWFSPDGKKLAFATFDDQEVDIMSIPYYGQPGSLESQYPKTLSLRYPKAGRSNPLVSLSVVSLVKEGENFPSPQELKLITPFKEPILSTVTWISNDKVAASVMNRVQNRAALLSCQAPTYECKQFHWLENKRGWINFFSPPSFSKDGNKMLFIDSQDQGDGLGAYRHLVLFDLVSNLTVPLTRGAFTVVGILAWDKDNHDIYFHATEENTPRNQQVYKVKDNVEANTQKPECLSCSNENMNCTFSSADLSKDRSYFALTCAGPGVPFISIFDKNNKKVMSWEDNKQLRNSLKDVPLPEVKFLEIPVGPRSMKAQVKLLIPPNTDKSGDKKYPLIVNVYGGPDSNNVFDRFKVSWDSYLCLNENIIIAYIDGRGSGLKGDDMLFANYRQFGNGEVIDQINVTRQLQLMHPFIDATRSAIWGWSYGGYATGMVLVKDIHNVFKCGISVAPVTDWLLYDSIYTERYMGLPTVSDNLYGYEASSLLNKARNLNDKMYFLVHGTLDDNVHYQQSMMLARSLELNDVLFKQQSYPDEVHSLGGVRHHLYRTLEQFFLQCFA